ncbi:MAG: hypothetical protein M1479_07055 [Actinobacteria bacterium]|nr:hypothetical protein [Cyanobacteriota bacterium]MCL5772014.1 hypothetical protein [Actinomycetota bacterium]
MNLSNLEKLYKRKLTKKELFEINNNLLGLINLLIEIDDEKNKDDRYNSSDNSKR